MRSILRAAALAAAALFLCACGGKGRTQEETIPAETPSAAVPAEEGVPAGGEVRMDTAVLPVERRETICEDEELKGRIDKLAKSIRFSGSVLVAKDFRILYAGGYGRAGDIHTPKNTALSAYAVGSISKQFTAAAILQLNEQGLLRLDDPVTAFFPDWPGDRPVTVENLLRMESGLERDFWNIAYREYGYTDMDQADGFQLSPHGEDELFALLYADGLHFAPGSRYQYSNVNYWLLSKIVTKVSGAPYQAYLAEHFFGPLGMTTAGTDYPDDLVPGHYGGERTTENADLYAGCGTVSGSVYDLYEWSRALHGGRVLSKESYRTMIRQTNGQYACGLVHDGNLIWHNGQLNGYNSYMGYDASTHVLLIVLSNSRTYDLRGQQKDFPAEYLAERLRNLMKD